MSNWLHQRHKTPSTRSLEGGAPRRRDKAWCADWWFHLIFLAFLALALGAPVQAQSPAHPEQLFRDALKKYDAAAYQEGLDLLISTRDALPKDDAPFNPALVHYNIGIGQFRVSQPAEAAVSFQEALRTSDIQLQAKAYYNLGNVQMHLAQEALNNGEVADGFQLYQSAATNYIQTLRLDANDRDAKVNYELAMQAQFRILQLVAMAMQHIQQGEQLVDQYQFVQAAQWFQQNFEQVEKALSLEPEAKKQLETLTQRTTSVAEILAPSAPPLPGGTP